MGSDTTTPLSQVFPVFDTVIRYANMSPASVTKASNPLAVVMSVTSFEICTPDCRGRGVIHDVLADTSSGRGAGDEEPTVASWVTFPASMSTWVFHDGGVY